MIYRRLKRFRKAFADLPPDIQAAVIKTFRLFRDDPGHPSLGIKKMVGHRNIWEGRITRNYRFTFEYRDDPVTGERICIFRNIGAHDILDRNP